ncbi:Holliday junction branch migration protein RuvA [Chloroflexota bacterium]
MIASLRGTLAAISKDAVVVQVGGVGFRVFVPQTLLDGSSGPGQEVTLFTHLHVRENELTLYGCESEEELALFRMLLSVSGIGPKVALAILSFLPPDRLRTAIAQEDVTLLARTPGIGPKTARKMVFDLRDKVAAELPAGEPRSALTEADADLIAALTGLGYSVAEAQEAIRALPREPLPLEERVRLALAYFGS